jgi:hypothetical protein
MIYETEPSWWNGWHHVSMAADLRRGATVTLKQRSDVAVPGSAEHAYGAWADFQQFFADRRDGSTERVSAEIGPTQIADVEGFDSIVDLGNYTQRFLRNPA